MWAGKRGGNTPALIQFLKTDVSGVVDLRGHALERGKKLMSGCDVRVFALVERQQNRCLLCCGAAGESAG